jgi:CRISPR/Cas system endoribonuclease Cas6 (RAMP superfamily)
MRFSVFIALLVATFAVCFSSFASAEAGDIKLTGWYSDAASDEERDASKIAVSFVNTMKQGAARKAAQRASELAVKNSVLSQKEVQKMGKLIANAAVKEPKKWSTLKKVIVGTLGTAGAAAVIAVAYNAMKGNSATTAATGTSTTTTTTTAGSL